MKPSISGKVFHEDDYGFTYGAVSVERTASMDTGHVFLTLTTPRQTVDICCTPTGLLRIGKPAKVRP